MTGNKLYLAACFTVYAVLFYFNISVALAVLAVDVGFCAYRYPHLFGIKRNESY